MLCLLRVLSIVNLAIVVLVRWFAGKSHTLSAHGWSVRSMGRLVDLLETKMLELKGNPSLVLNKDFMMNKFSS